MTSYTIDHILIKNTNRSLSQNIYIHIHIVDDISFQFIKVKESKKKEDQYPTKKHNIKLNSAKTNR